MRKILCLLTFAVVLIAGSSLLAAEEFQLDHVSHHFPYQGFEHQIEFWRQIFTVYGERDIVFHDRQDLRIIYEVVRFQHPVRNDPEEADRQKEILKNRKEEIQHALDELSRGSEALSPLQEKILHKLQALGYSGDRKFFSSLSDDVRYQRGIKEEFQDGLVRSGKYQPAIERVFSEEGLPVELAALPHIESSFRHQVLSKAGAVGLWQIMKSTGRRYLKINRYLDQRYDPLDSTRAAAQILRYNYERLKSWPMAITAYNHGLQGMLRARKQFGTDFLKISRKYRSRSFGFASRNFYPEFLAALDISRNYEKYFGPLELESELVFDTVRLARSVPLSDLESSESLTRDELREYNPALRSRVWRDGLVPAGITLRIPAGRHQEIASRLEAAHAVAGVVEPEGKSDFSYRVRRGDTLSGISAMFGVSSSEILSANRIRNRNRIYPGQLLTIPSAVLPESVRYTVKKGDTLGGIGTTYGVSISQIQRANGLSDRNRIYPGQELVIPSTQSSKPLRYRVQRGDTLATIAQKFKTTIRSIQRANRLPNPNRIFLGQILLIP